MKYILNTYDNFLDLNLEKLEQITGKDFNLYTEEELKKLGKFICQYNDTILQINKNIKFNIYESLQADLTNKQFIQMSYRNLLNYFQNQYEEK